MKLNLISKLVSSAVLTALPVSIFAAALDRSGQSIAPFLQPGNYAELGATYLEPSVSGEDLHGNKVSDIANGYESINAAIKLQPHKNISFGILFDQPFGADVTYQGDNDYVAKLDDPVLPLPGVDAPLGALPGAYKRGSTDVDVQSNNISFITGIQPNKNLNFYGGLVYQEVEGDLTLRGQTYSLYNGYNATIGRNSDWGWLAGAAFEIPEIALKAAITYRSEIEHEIKIDETISVVDSLANNPAAAGAIIAQVNPAMQPALTAALTSLSGLTEGYTNLTTPQSVNLDLQTGIMADTIAFANVRWVDWSKFSIRPHQFGQISQAVGPLIGKSADGFNLVDYADDQWSANVGIGRKLNEQFGGSVSVGWDSGAGNPTTTLGPTEGYWNLGLAMRYSPVPNVELSAGVKYFWLGDADAQTGAHSAAGEFEDNDAWATGLKVAYRF